MTTRRVLLLAAGVSGLSALCGFRAIPLLRRGIEAAATHQLRAPLRHPESARIIGRLYRGATPSEAEASILTRRLLASLRLDEAELGMLPEDALRARLRARIRADFSAGRIVVIEGWILSRTEARLCALWA